MIKPLVISQNYLIENAPGGQVERAFFERGSEFGYDFTVVASDYKPIASSTLNTFTIHQSKAVQYLAALTRRALIPDLANLPDYEYYAWGIRAEKKCRQLLENQKFDLIHTINYPCCCHTIGLHLKEKYGLPWIAQFYDPWYDSPYRVFKTKYFKRIDLENEKAIALHSDIIIHTNDAIANIWRERYGEDVGNKIRVFPIPISEPPQLKINKHDVNKLVISHIGNFMLNRTSEPFIEAVSQLCTLYPKYKQRIKVNYIGNVTNREIKLIGRLRLNDVFDILGRKNETECFEYYQKSDMFLAIDGINQVNVFFPSKILKYLLYQKPILGITPNDSVLNMELNKSGHLSFEANQKIEIAEYLRRAIEDYSSTCAFDENYYKHFLVNNIYKQYIDVVNQLLK